MKTPKLYGLIGYPLGHSFSAKYFAEKFQKQNIDAAYQNFAIENIDLLPEVLNANPTLQGLNVTIPYKQQILPFLDEIDESAQRIGAVNVVCVKHTAQGIKLIGHNADVIGFKNSISPLIKPHHAKALVLGTGGASKAVIDGLHQLNIATQYVSRTKKGDILAYSDLTPEIIEDFKVIVNCTPLGMYPKTDAAPDIPYNCITKEHLLYDLVYNPEETLFLRKGKEHGATVKNGLEMLHLQAEASWNFWNAE